MEDKQIVLRFHRLHNQFEKSCQQIEILHRKVKQIQLRLDRAAASGQRSFLYNQELQLINYECLQNVYRQYVDRCETEMEEIHDYLIHKQR